MTKCFVCGSLMTPKAIVRGSCRHCHTDIEACNYLLEHGIIPSDAYVKLSGRQRFWHLTLEVAKTYVLIFSTNYDNAN